MGRNRKSNNKLPPYVYFAKGRYIWRPYINGKLGKETRLLNKNATLAEIWTAYESVSNQDINTLLWLLESFFNSNAFSLLSLRTQSDYHTYKTRLITTKLQGGRFFGAVALKDITPGVIRKYLDRRGQDAPVQANREISLISSAWNWGRERDLCGANPCQGVKRNKEKPRDLYITDSVYQFVYDLACHLSPPYIPPAMEIAYLCRARKIEILSLKDSDENIKNEGLYLKRHKKSRSQIISWSLRLRKAIVSAQDLPGHSPEKFLFHNKSGNKIISSTFDTAWQRLLVKADLKGLKKRFTFHDLKAKGVSDFVGDKKLASGHRSDKMVEVYDRLPSIINPTK